MELELPSYLGNIKLNGTNNFKWCNDVELHLTAIGLEHHLTEEAPIGGQRKINVWKLEEAQIVNLMKKTMEPDIAIMCGCTSRKSCKEIWDNVRSMYSRDRTKLYELWVKFIRLKQGNMSVTEYSNVFCGMYYELEKALPITDDKEQMKKVNEMLLTFCFLQGLRPEYEPAVYQILREAELPSREEICRRLSVLSFASTKDERVSSYDRNSSLNDRGPHRGLPRKCGRQNHTRNQCWDLFGKPF